MSSWLINAFNGEWLRMENPMPKVQIDGKEKEKAKAKVKVKVR